MDKTKAFEAAGKFASKGQLDKAAKEYQRILDEDPKDVRALQKLSEIHQKNGKAKEAADLMLRVAEGYGEQGFFLKAVAVYKQVLKLGIERIDVNLKLAQLYQQLGLVGDATQQYQAVANFHDKNGNVKESLAALRKMVDLDPDNVASRVKLGELYARERMNAEAVTELKRASSYLKKNNRADDHLRVLERIGQLVPDDVPVAKELSQLFLAKQDAKRALARLQVCFRQNPKDVETLTLLAQAFQALGQDGKVVSVYRELAAVHAENGQGDARRRALQRVLELVPDDPDATQALREPERREPAAPAPKTIVPPAPASSSAVAPPAVRPTSAAPKPGPAQAAARGSSAPPAGTPASVLKTLTEVDVYLKYGLLPKAVDHLQKALKEAPESVAALEKLVTVLDKQNKGEEAAAIVARLVDLARRKGDCDTDSVWTQELGQRVPGHPLVAAAAAAADLGGDGDVVVEGDAAEVEASALAQEALDDEVVAGEELYEEVSTEPTIPPGHSPPLASSPSAPAPWDEPVGGEDEAIVVDAEPVEPPPPRGPFQMDSRALDEALGIPPPAPQPAPFAPDEGLDPFAVMSGSETGPRGRAEDEAVVVLEEEAPAPVQREQELGVAVTQRTGPVATVAPEPSAAALLDAPSETFAEAEDDLFGEEVAEAEFLIQQGLLDDAKYALEAILAQAPHHTKAAELYRQFSEREMTSPPGVSPVAPATSDQGFNLGSELADELDGAFAAAEAPKGMQPGPDGQFSVDDVLSEFKKKLSETLPPEDSQTHYDLGIAFKEMGLFDEAIGEFDTAMRGTGQRRVVDCLIMLGVCTLEKSAPAEAIVFFERALKTPGLTLEASKEAHYEVGHCHELLGDDRAAMDRYGRVFKADGQFRDVRARLMRLREKHGLGTTPAKPGGSPAAAAGAPKGAPKAGPGKAGPAKPSTAAQKPAPAAPGPAATSTTQSGQTNPAPAGRGGGKIGYV